MYFYIDESGHTGPNLFDPAQPTLYYGVLSATGDVDVLAARRVAKLRKKLGVERLHAAELGNGRLASIANDIRAIQKVLGLRFDLYRVVKPDHAIICFFDQVFDSGMNPAITWTGYWTPLRFVLLLKLATLFDEGLAKLAWAARIEINDAVAQQKLVEVCTGLLARVSTLPDARSRELISDTLQWAIDHPADIGYNVNDEEMRLQVFDQFSIGETDELSLKALAKRWTQWFEELPEPTAEQFECGKELMEMTERRRKEALANSAGGTEDS